MKIFILSLCLIGLLFIGQSGAGETQKPPLQVAIYPFQAVGIGETVATVITNAVYRELVNSNKLIVRDQKSTQAAIDQIGLSQSGLCSEDACTVEAGKIIKAQKLIMGSVEMVMENYYTVSMRVVDVQTARTEYQVQHDCKSCKNNVEIRDFAVKVVKETILVYLETGKKAEYKPSETTTTASTSTVSATAPTSGTVSISSAPTGADVYVDGNFVGKTPINFSGVTAGPHKVELELAGYQIFEVDVNVAANQVVPVNAKLTLTLPPASKTDSTPAPSTTIGDNIATSSSIGPNEVGSLKWGFKFTLPNGWQYEFSDDVAILTSKSVKGVISVVSHDHENLDGVKNELQGGVHIPSADFNWTGKSYEIGNNAMAFDQLGYMNGKRMTGHFIGTISPYGGGAMIMGFDPSKKFSIQETADSIAKGIQYFQRVK